MTASTIGKELNFATAELVRLILRRRPPGYPWHPGLDAVIRRFIADWQDPATGFFGAGYEVADRLFRTADLSLTFHMARYLEGRIGYWPQLIDTLIAMRGRRYPNGWLDEAGMTSHNNYDVAVLFQLGWAGMRPDQRPRASRELERLTDWCLDTAIAPDGRVVARGGPGIAARELLFHDRLSRYGRLFRPGETVLDRPQLSRGGGGAARLERHVRELNLADPMARMALDRLHPIG